MQKKRTSILTRIGILILVIGLIVPMGAYASVVENDQTRASAYLSYYTSYVYSAGGGLVQVWFSVGGNGYLDEIGALSIELYECSTNSSDISDWTWKETFKHSSTDGMLSYNDDYHSGHVDYNGTIGKWYRAYVCIWGGKDGDGDTRYFWTSGQKATLLPD